MIPPLSNSDKDRSTGNKMSESAAGHKGFFTRLSHRITAFRDFTINAFFILFLLFALVGLIGSCDSPQVPKGSALIINPAGALVEEASAPLAFPDFILQQGPVSETVVEDVIYAINTAAEDKDIKMLILDLEDLTSASSAQAYRIGIALENFRESGKNIVSYADYYEQYQYHIASFSDEIYMHPMGGVQLTGFGGNNLYFKGLLDNLLIDVEVFKVGKFKSAVEPYTEQGMSDESRLANSEIYESLWAYYMGDIVSNRSIELESLRAYANEYDEVIDAADGDTAEAAVTANLIDDLLTREVIRNKISELVGWDEDGISLNAISMNGYLSLKPKDATAAAPTLGVIIAQGPIMDGPGIAGSIGADDMIQRIRSAKNDQSIKGLILRVDSPGGSAFASELIRQELEAFQNTGRPVVASFASVAASGGYWISATSDKIVAEARTITGSIGIFGLIPTAQRALEKIGVNLDGVGTTPYTLDGPFSGLSEETSNVLQKTIEHGYEQFIGLVAKGRDMTTEDVDAVAQGRVWHGEKALSLGLVDELGDLEAAADATAELAGLSEWSLRYLSAPVDPRQEILRQLLQSSLPLGDSAAPIESLFSSGRKGFESIKLLNDKRDTYAICLECAGKDF